MEIGFGKGQSIMFKTKNETQKQTFQAILLFKKKILLFFWLFNIYTEMKTLKKIGTKKNIWDN